jgi:hypothetical protein
MIILGVCQDPLYPSNIYILYKWSSTIMTTIGNFTTPTGTYTNLYITYSNSYSTNAGLTSSSTNFNFNTEVRVVLDTSGTNSDANNIVLSGSIFAYNNIVYVIYTNGIGKLFLSRLTYTPSGANIGLVFDTANKNTFYVSNTFIDPTTVTSGEGRNIGKHVLDYSLDNSNKLVLHILYHGALLTSYTNKVYYYINVTDLTSLTPIFSTPECVVPPSYQNNVDSTTRLIGYGDMVIDRIYNRIYVVYSTHNFPVSSDSYNKKEFNRFVVYTFKNFTDNYTSWNTNTQFDICTGTNSGFAQAIYRNPNSSTENTYSACDYYPKLYLKNTTLHMVTMGSHYNGY